MTKKNILIIAGEASGDLHGANLVREIQHRHKRVSFFGIGGNRLKAAGVDIVIESAELSVVGITEVIAKAPGIIRSIKTIRRLIRARRPDLAILIDFPDFNFQVAQYAQSANVPVLYYISPQIWAWRTGRVHKIKRIVDHMAVILPFEERFYRKFNVPVSFVGHPLLDNQWTAVSRDTEKNNADSNIIGLLPGSRDTEIQKLLPIMLEAAALLKNRIPGIRFQVSMASSVDESVSEEIVNRYKTLVDVELIGGDVTGVLSNSRIVIAASGTVTLEAAITCTPMVIVYKVSPVSYWLGKALVRVKYISLVNLIAGREIVPELIQDQAGPGRVSEEVFQMYTDEKRYDRIKRNLRMLRDRLGGKGASGRVAQIAVDMLRP